MVRRLKVDCDQLQLGLFGEGLALGSKPKLAKVLPIAPRAVVLAARDPAKLDWVQSLMPNDTKDSAKSKRLSSLPPEIVRASEAASLLSVSLSLLKKWRMAGGGPRFVRLGGRAIGYRRVDLSEWIEGLM
jgi:predicted DNA-binding transcriptional regulator AlpA